MGATANIIDTALRKIPVVSEIVGIIDGIFGFFGGGGIDASAARMRELLDQEADKFTHKFRDLIHEVTNSDDLEALARHINKAAGAVTDSVSLQRIALQLQATMAEKAMQLTHDAKAKLGAEMQASIDALHARKQERMAAGQAAVDAVMQAGEAEHNALARRSKEVIADRTKCAAEVGQWVEGYISKLDALRDTVVRAAKHNNDALGDIAATAQSTEFSKRISSVSVRSARRGTGTTTVVRPSKPSAETTPNRQEVS